ncbi:MAG: glycosyltransferase family 2 protein [Proteiniphilum sp.]|nr:glycosyltransferase family 2 protein [Proteiniphilum sp.]MDD3910426.1 glycosyltransferase family 2 protein [Proteiniphilum sp.]MDD4415477.1 glycosyltransferase family 2 protein [Proteiniphilum sp.]
MLKLSVITVTFNAEMTLERTLKSVQEQTYHNIEHVIVDGASKDDTPTLISRYSNEKMKWMSEPDKGLYDAMNKAVAMASGDYICFLNAGDTFFEKETVEKIMQSFKEKASPDILYGETAIVNGEGEFLHMRRLKAPDRLSWKSFKMGMLVCHQAFFVKRILFEPYDVSYRFSSDFDWCIRMMKKAASIYNTRSTLINYLKEGMTTANRKASLRERYRIMVKYYGHLSTLIHHAWFVIRAVIKRDGKK